MVAIGCWQTYEAVAVPVDFSVPVTVEEIRKWQGKPAVVSFCLLGGLEFTKKLLVDLVNCLAASAIFLCVPHKVQY
jgi:hypothetical protein